MNEEEREQFNKLTAQVHILHYIVIELCRRNLSNAEIDRFTTALDPDIARGHPDLAETLDQALLKFRTDLMLPIMGC